MILDTNAVSSFFAGDKRVREQMLQARRIHLPLIVSGEYRFGLQGSKKNHQLEELLQILERECNQLTIDVETTRRYARLRHELKRSGTPIPENDLWIAAMADQHRLPILSRDKHFDNISSITRLDW